MCRSSREFTWIVRRVIAHAGKLICNSENTARLLRDNWNAKEEQIHVLNPGVDGKFFRPADSDLSSELLPGKKVLLTVSRLQPRKGHDVLIAALPEILKNCPEVVYVIVGSGNQEQRLRDLTGELGLGDSVLFEGELEIDQIRKWYQRADLFVLPNRKIGNDVEGFGIVLLESQACGTPVVAGDSGGTRETMKIGKTGYVVDCRNSEELGSLVTKLFIEPDVLPQMGRAARQHILDFYDWPRIMDRAENIFRPL